MTTQQQLAALEPYADVIDPEGEIEHVLHLTGVMPDWLRLAGRLDQAEKWIEAWCSAEGFCGEFTLRFRDKQWTLSVERRGRSTRSSTGRILAASPAEALAAALQKLTAGGG